MSKDSTGEWSIDQWDGALSSLIKDITPYIPFRICCSQLSLVESFGNSKYCQLLYSMQAVHYANVNLSGLMAEYHQLLPTNYVFEKLCDNHQNLTLFHPLLAMFEFASSRIDFIDVIVQNKDNEILCEFLMISYLWQTNQYLLDLVFERISFLETESHFSFGNYLDCIYSKIKDVFDKNKSFQSHFRLEDIKNCFKQFEIFIMREFVQRDSALCDRLLQTVKGETFHLIQCIFRHNPLFLMYAMNKNQKHCLQLLAYLNVQQNEDRILFILTICVCPFELIEKEIIYLFIHQTHNCWNMILSFLRKHCDENQKECLYEYHNLLIQTVANCLKSNQYLHKFEALKLLMSNEGNYCIFIMAQFWIETTENETYKIWKSIMNADDFELVSKEFVESILCELSLILPIESECSYKPLHLSKLPLVTIKDFLCFLRNALVDGTNEEWLLPLLQSDDNVSMLLQWYEMVNKCLIHCFDHSKYLTLCMDEFVFEMLRLLQQISTNRRNEYLLQHANISLNMFDENWNDEHSIFDIFCCDDCDGILNMGCNKIVTMHHHSFSIQISLVVFGFMCSDFDFLFKIISYCADIAIINVLKTITNYIRYEKAIKINDALMLKTKKIFYFWNNIKEYRVCEEVLNLWGYILKYGQCDSDHMIDDVFGIYTSTDIHKICLDSLHMNNAPELFCLMMETMKNSQNKNSKRVVVNDLKELKYCKTLMNVHEHFDEESVDKIGNMIEALMHLIQSGDKRLKRKLFDLLSDDDESYPLFLYSICKLIGKWNAFSIEDIENVLKLINEAMESRVWKLAFACYAKDKYKNKQQIMKVLLKEWAAMINTECEDVKEKMKLKGLMTEIFKKIGKCLQQKSGLSSSGTSGSSDSCSSEN